MTTNDSDAQERTDHERIVDALRAAGYSDHEAAAQLAIPQTHLSDWTRRGGQA